MRESYKRMDGKLKQLLAAAVIKKRHSQTLPALEEECMFTRRRWAPSLIRERDISLNALAGTLLEQLIRRVMPQS